MNNLELRELIDGTTQYQILWFVTGMVVMAVIQKIWGKK